VSPDQSDQTPRERPRFALRLYRWTRETEIEASRPAGASRGHDTHQLHAMAPGLVSQTIERTGGYKQDATRSCRRQDSGS
jgi:hypothetical protein